MTQTANTANEYAANVGHDFTMSDALDPEYLDAEDERQESHPLSKIREVVTVRRGREVVKHFVGPFQI